MKFEPLLKLSSCPNCRINNPTLSNASGVCRSETNDGISLYWAVYTCKNCGIPTTAVGDDPNLVLLTFPQVEEVDECIPDRPRKFLEQALLSLSAPSGCRMLCASSVDAMLKERGYTEGTLYKRIDKAIADHILTSEMGTWAHQIRLDANDERHADEAADFPTVQEAKNAIQFAKALAEYLYVLPAKIKVGIGSDLPST